MTYPAIDKYNEAVQKPQIAFVDPTLQRGQVASNAFGLPIALGGGSALTYTVTSSGKKFAVRCFHKEVQGLQNRYAKISSTLATISNSCFVGSSINSPVSASRVPRILSSGWIGPMARLSASG
ncbi:MAG: hypothetical protein FD153_629 [Rhodospirillaceae bacterium]|nr:MAG: hypothetical protein FD153_629 [Rhodospirillaceae bacterium]